jgi:hypothetical protein
MADESKDPLAPPGPEDIIQANKPAGGLPCPDPAPQPPLVNEKVTAGDKIALGFRQSLVWDGVRHFLFGSIYAGGAAIGAVAAGFKMVGLPATAAIAGAFTPPFGWIIAGLAVTGGLVEAGRKVAKEKSGGKDWTDAVYKLLEFAVQIILQVKAKGAKK